MNQSTITPGALPRRRLSLRFTEKTMPSCTASTMPLSRTDLRRIVEEMVG
ncbi:MAG: hypothetical protein JF628_03735 [Sphingomonas sp.]|nr:hypothetical protein [Sphingomonas sp.]